MEFFTSPSMDNFSYKYAYANAFSLCSLLNIDLVSLIAKGKVFINLVPRTADSQKECFLVDLTDYQDKKQLNELELFLRDNFISVFDEEQPKTTAELSDRVRHWVVGVFPKSLFTSRIESNNKILEQVYQDTSDRNTAIIAETAINLSTVMNFDINAQDMHSETFYRKRGNFIIDKISAGNFIPCEENKQDYSKKLF